MGEICSLIWSSIADQTQDQKPLHSKRKQVESLEKRNVTWKTYIKKVFPPWGNFIDHSPSFHVVAVQSLSCVRFFATPWTAACQAPVSSTFSQSLLKYKSIESVMLSNHLILCLPFFCPQSFPASGSFPMSWLLVSGGQSTGASASKTDLPMNIKGSVFPKYWITLIPYSVCSPYDSEPLPALGRSRPNVELRKPIALACRICPEVWERPLLL